MSVRWYMLVFVLGLFFTKQANAQYLSVRGFFEIDQQLGCHDLTVNINSLVPDVITFRYKGLNSPNINNPFFTYTEPGSYWIYQFHQGAGGDERVDSIFIEIVLPEAPVFELQSCNNLEVLVQINDTYYDEYEINYGDGTIITVPKNSNIPPYSFANNTQRNIAVTGLFTTANNRCGVTSILFDPLAQVLPAQIDSLILLGNSSLKIDYALPPNSINKLEVSVNNNANYVLFNSLEQNTVIDTVTQLNLDNNTYCFRIATYDACSNFKSYSNEVCSIQITATAENNQIATNWTTINLGALQTNSLIRDKNLIQSSDASFVQYTDTTVICNTTYCYQTQVAYNGAISQSLEACTTSFSSDIPPTVDNISSWVNPDSIEWTWQVPLNTTPLYYKVFQTLADGSIIGEDSINTNAINQQFENSVKYISVQIVDICDNTSPLNLIGSSLLLNGEIDSSSDTQLSWNNFSGWIDGFQGYYLTIKDKNEVLIDSVYTGADTFYTYPLAAQEEQTIICTVWAIPLQSSIAVSRSNQLTFERDPVINFPNSFTPNGDGLNDKLIVSGKFISTYEMQIFNRWGEMLFQTTDIENGWNGTSNNKKLPTGNYAFWVRIKDLNENEHIRTGSILILSN